MSQTPSLTLGQVRQALRERVSAYNANLMLHAALSSSGLRREDNEVLEAEEAKALCMALINRGGPSFQVGKSLMQNLQ